MENTSCPNTHSKYLQFSYTYTYIHKIYNIKCSYTFTTTMYTQRSACLCTHHKWQVSRATPPVCRHFYTGCGHVRHVRCGCRKPVPQPCCPGCVYAMMLPRVRVRHLHQLVTCLCESGPPLGEVIRQYGGLNAGNSPRPLPGS